MSEKISVSEIFGMNVFNDAVMCERLPKKVYEELKDTINNGSDLSPEVAEVVASAMKDWAIERGATHYTHWFQPMTGITAEKHDAFVSPLPNGKAIMEFSGKELTKGEPDASSFPSGGLRATFEARGYTAWDCTSYAFIRENGGESTLCIPTAFCSYGGEALDKKTPLLRSMEALNVQAMRILRLFGNTTSKRVITCVGPEQEYFLVDKQKYLQRDDLIFTGRTLFGAMPPKGQEMDDHYFGSIRHRVAEFMRELNIELWKLGVSAKTQHNEGAPAQHELAPIYATANVAADHNQLIMWAMKKVASKQGLKCLLHEKPFEGVNGSGKHNNWSMVTDDGIQLLSPGKEPQSNTQFLLFLMAVLQAVDLHADLLRMSAANPGNEHRLGADEAPPAIISVFLGDQLTDILEHIEKGEAVNSKRKGRLDVGVHTLPSFRLDETDRNRTSPFAFTGNKFEFRMVPSSASISGPNIVINTIVADSLCNIADELEKAKDFDKAVKDIILRLIKNHKRIIFNGNGYSDEWVKEAARRGLPNLPTMVDSIPAFLTDKSVELFGKHKVFSETELHARTEIKYETYVKAVTIEAKTMVEMARRQIMPAVVEYTTRLADSVNSVVAAGGTAEPQKETLRAVQTRLAQMSKAVKKLEASIKKSAAIAETDQRARFIRDTISVDMKALRKPADELEMLVDRDLWPFPTYGELMFDL